MKTQTMRAIRDYRDMLVIIQKELQKIDPGLKDEIREKREAGVWEKYQKHLDAHMGKIQAGRKWAEAERLKAADPFTSLLRKTWQAEDKPGLRAVCDGLALMSPEQQIAFAKELGHPALALKAITNIRSMDLEPVSRMALNTRVQELTQGYADKAAIRDHAEVEKQCIETQILENKTFNGSPEVRGALGNRLNALDKIIVSGTLPKYEQIDTLSHPNPVDRMAAARKAG